MNRQFIGRAQDRVHLVLVVQRSEFGFGLFHTAAVRCRLFHRKNLERGYEPVSREIPGDVSRIYWGHDALSQPL